MLRRFYCRCCSRWGEGGLNPSGTCSPRPGGRGPSQTPPSLATDSSISPGPPSPWLPALPIERRFYRFCTELATPKTSPPAGACLARSVSAANGLMQGCRGRSPRRNKLLVSPFPPGRGAGGWGQESKPKAGLAGDKEGTPPRWGQRRQGQPATSRASHPPGAWFAPCRRAPGAPLQPNHAGITCCFGDNITKIP